MKLAVLNSLLKVNSTWSISSVCTFTLRSHCTSGIKIVCEDIGTFVACTTNKFGQIGQKR